MKKVASSESYCQEDTEMPPLIDGSEMDFELDLDWIVTGSGLELG